MDPLPLPGFAALSPHLFINKTRSSPASPYPVLDVIAGKTGCDGKRSLVSCISALRMSNFTRLFGLLADRGERERLARELLEALSDNEGASAVNDPVAVNALVSVCKAVAESVNAMSTAGELNENNLLLLDEATTQREMVGPH